MAKREHINGLYSQIAQNRFLSISGEHFTPPARIEEIFTEVRVKNAVAELVCETYERKGLAKKVFQEGRIVFAILIWMGKPDAIVTFRNHECLDHSLPLSEAKATVIVPDFGRSFACEFQWQFKPYLLKQHMSDQHCNIDDTGTIFPFVKEQKVGEGGHGEISKIEIQTSCQELLHSTQDTVEAIRKRIKRRKLQTSTQYNNDFSREMSTLRLLHCLRHPNIVPLLGSYTFKEEHNFLFPHYRMDLEAFFTRDSRPRGFQEDFTFTLALADLASALEHTHNLHLDMEKDGLAVDAVGYHYDFRPANILVGETSYILADFGLSKLKSIDLPSETPWKKGAGDYIAPECMNSDFVHQRVGRSIDVWAFGCLISEVATYMERGAQGVQQFRQFRLEELIPGWNLTYFYGTDRKLKKSVREWLNELANTSSPLTKQLVQIAFEALAADPAERPSISEIRSSLSIRSLRITAATIQARIAPILDKGDFTNHVGSSSMQLWFEMERFQAFNQVLSLDSEGERKIFEGYEMYKNCCSVMLKMIDALRGHSCSDRSDEILGLSLQECPVPQNAFEEEFQRLVEDLWNLLPRSYAQRAQAKWIQMMRSDDMDRLNRIDVYMRQHRREDFADIGALAHMRAIRLQMLNNPTVGAEEFLRPRGELTNLDFINGHTYGFFREDTRVLVEWMYYRREWTRIPDAQRLVIMELRAKDFNTDPKPEALCTLKCLGIVEQTGTQNRKHGYGFMYEIPTVERQGITPIPVTLRQLLLEGVDRYKGYDCRPPLHGRYQLAHTLSQFFDLFYTIGYLHESFSSNNIIFCHDSQTIFQSSTIWSKAYVIGFQKSRPDGQAWATEGPADDTTLKDYEHPDYHQKGRFLLEYDYYSLGLVLLEIGLWCPLEAWAQRKGSKTMTPQELRQLLIQRYVPRLAATVGETYRDVVSICMNGTLEREQMASFPTPEAEVEIFDQFIERVVKPLERLSSFAL